MIFTARQSRKLFVIGTNTLSPFAPSDNSMSNQTLLQQRIQAAITRHGSIRAAAAVLDVDYTYLYRLSTGERDNPHDNLLRKLKLRRVVTYYDIKEKA